MVVSDSLLPNVSAASVTDLILTIMEWQSQCHLPMQLPAAQGYNVLCHLEEVEYLQQTGHPNCMVSLDFSKAYDRLSRPGVLDCITNMGFRKRACKSVSIMLENTSATAVFNSWQSSSFPERGTTR